MSAEWPWLRLGECCLKIGSGSTPTGGKDAYLDHGPFMLIRSQNIYNDGFKPGGLAFISNEQAKKLDGVAVEVDDVLLNITGDSVARVCLAKEQYLPARVNQHVAIIRTKPAVFDNRFVRYFLASGNQQDLMLGLAAAGATRNALTKSMIEDFKVPCPPIAIQRGIANTLSALDDRITLLRETNATLEGIAQALFKSWFVDFDPVRANIARHSREGGNPDAMGGSEALDSRLRGNDGTVLDEATAQLFPDELEESELGLVPRGWRVGPIGESITVVDFVANGSFASLKENVTLENTPSYALYLRTTDFNSGYSGDFRYVNQSAYKFLSKSSLDGTEVIISNVGDVGTVFRPPTWLGLPMTLGSNAVALKALGHSAFMYLYFSGAKGQHDIGSIVTGSAQLKFNKTNFRSLLIALPEAAALQRFESIAGALLSTIDINLATTQTLATLRDTLLPRLISGQLLIPSNSNEVLESEIE